MRYSGNCNQEVCELKEIDSEDFLWRWLSKAKPGEKAVYYDGFLMMDKEYHFKNGGTTHNIPSQIRIAIEMWKAYLSGAVSLVQRKKNRFSYEYIAIKS